jgi:uncharacterized protein with von Willebrand factor type A (vWA) domain
MRQYQWVGHQGDHRPLGFDGWHLRAGKQAFQAKEVAIMIRKVTFTGLVAALALVSFVTTASSAAQQAVPAPSGKNIVFILDASGSMWGQVEGKAKIVIAQCHKL